MEKKVKKAKREKKAATEEGTVMGEALKKAGLATVETPAEVEGDEPKIELVKNMAYDVAYRYEAETGKVVLSTSTVLDCRNAQDAQTAILAEIAKRGLNPDNVEFVTTEPNPEKQQESVIEGSLPPFGETAQMFPDIPEDEDAPTYRCVKFVGKLGDMTVKNGNRQSVTIKIDIFGEDCVSLGSSLVNLFKKREDVHFTAVPFQMHINDVQRKAPEKQKEPVSIPTKSIDGVGEVKPDDAFVVYTCPHCGGRNEVLKNNHPSDWKCQHCEKYFPIEFDSPIPEQDDSLFENGNGVTPEADEVAEP